VPDLNGISAVSPLPRRARISIYGGGSGNSNRSLGFSGWENWWKGLRIRGFGRNSPEDCI